MPADTPLVSVIMPVYNGGDYLINSINSVINQSYQNWELIIVNDGSTDNSDSIMNNFKDSRIRIFNQNNAGVAKARNTGINKSKGRYIAFLDADDIWISTKLEIQIQYMEAYPLISMSFTDYFSQNQQGELIMNKQLYPFKLKEIKERLLVFNFIATLTVVIRREIIESSGGFDVTLFGPEDWDLWIRISKHGEINFIDQKLSIYREHIGGISKNKAKQLEEEYKILDRYVLIEGDNLLKKYALWFYNFKLANHYLTLRDYRNLFFVVIKIFTILPFKVENFIYVFRRILRK